MDSNLVNLPVFVTNYGSVLQKWEKNGHKFGLCRSNFEYLNVIKSIR